MRHTLSITSRVVPARLETLLERASLRIHISLIGSSQPLAADVAADGLDELAAEMTRVRCLQVKGVETGGLVVAHSALVPVHRVQMISILDE